MAGRYFRLANSALLIILSFNSIYSSKLNVPRVLLPLFSDISTNFTLEATEGGCYKWTTSRQDIIRLIPIEIDLENDCSSRVVVSSISKDPTRNTAIVFAEEIDTAQILRCDVIVDTIFSLSIVTTTRELFMDEAPEAFEVNAYDDQGNEFSTLEGIPFDWAITGVGNVEVLRFISFKDSPYETPPTVEMFDSSDMQGHIILLEGVKTGSAKVSVKLPHAEYQHVKICEVQLMVIANIIIDPADAYILKGDEVLYKIYQIHNGKLEEINIVESQYYLQIESPDIASIAENSGLVTGLTEGRTKIVLHDKNIGEAESNGIKLPSVQLTVAVPAYVTISLLPFRNWAVLISDRHEIVVEVFSESDHKIYLSENVEIQTEVGELFPISQRSNNGSWLVGKGIEQGVAPVEATVLAVSSPKFGRLPIGFELKAKNEILIFPRLLLQPTEAIFPWDPITKPRYELQIDAIGGDGKYIWYSSNHSVGTVNQNGLVRTTYRGYFEVSAAMTRNHHNRQIAKIYVLPALRLEIVEFAMEAEVGELIYLHVALYVEIELSKGGGKKFLPVTQCQNLNFKVKTSDSNFVYNKTAHVDLVGISCANVAMSSSQVGTSKVTVQYMSDGTLLEDSVTIGAYNKLRVAYPSTLHTEVVLALGTSAQLKFVGGPRPWPGRQNHHEVKVASALKQIVRARDRSGSLSLPPETHVVHVLCKKLGESVVTMSIKNAPGSPSCKSQATVAGVTVVCGKPRNLVLTPDMQVANASSCPMTNKNDNAMVQSYKNIELDVVVQDELGRPFLNVSSLQFAWTVSPDEFGTFAVNDSVVLTELEDGPVTVSNKSTQVIYPKAQSGSILVRATVTGYRPEILNLNAIVPEVPNFVDADDKTPETPVVTATINLYLVGDTTVTPNLITIYNHPENKRRVHINQGSGYYELGLTAADICDVNYKEGVREIDVTPMNDGQVEVTLTDLCLASEPAIIVVNVVSVRAIKVEMPDKVEIGKCVRAIVRLYDENDNAMPVPDMKLLGLQPYMEDEIANVKLMLEDPSAADDDRWKVGEVHFVVTGTVLGETKIEFVVGENANAVTSGPYDLQVFPPLRLMPRNVTMLLGSTLQITTTGGPQPDSNIEYQALSSLVVDISNTGGIQGTALGQSKIVGRAIGSNSISGQPIIYSQDQIDVNVVPIRGIQIFTPLSRFQTGAKVPVWALGLPEKLSPIILGTVVPEFQFAWSVTDSSVVRVESAFQATGIEYGNNDQVSMRLVGIRPGAATLKLLVTVPGMAANCTDKQVFFRAKIELEVFDNFLLTSPEGISGTPILIAPHSKVQIGTNKDALNQVTYKLHAVQPDAQSAAPAPLVTITDSGTLESHGGVGEATVVVTATDEHGLKQVLAVVVLVKPIHYMTMEVVADWQIRSDYASATVPVGVQFKLRAAYHDNTGAVFTGAPSTELRTLMNRFDLARVAPLGDNATFGVASRKAGNTVLRVWADGNHKTVDYVKINAKQVVDLKQSHVTSGDLFCLWSPVVAVPDRQASWDSSDADQVTVDSRTGLARVVTAKGTLVDVVYTLTPASSLQMEVLPVTEITLTKSEKSRDVALTNAQTADDYVVSVLLTSDRGEGKTSNVLTAWKCKGAEDALESYPFSCHIYFKILNEQSVDVAEVFTVQPGFDASKGLYHCKIATKCGGQQTADSKVSLLDAKVVLYAVADSGLESDYMHIDFVPSVTVQPAEIQIGELFMETFTVVGRADILKDLTVTVSDEAMLVVNRISQPTSTSIVYQVKLIDYHWKLDNLEDPMNVVVVSPSTGHVTKVPVRTSLSSNSKVGAGMGVCSAQGVPPGTPLSGFFYAYRHTLAIVVSMIIIFLVTVYVYSNYVNPVIHVNVRSPTAERQIPNVSLLNASRDPYRNMSPPASRPCDVCACQHGNRVQGCAHRQNLSSSVFDSSTEPIYGDPKSFYQSAELRRNRRFL